jgi:hypothetical protein
LRKAGLPTRILGIRAYRVFSKSGEKPWEHLGQMKNGLVIGRRLPNGRFVIRSFDDIPCQEDTIIGHALEITTLSALM